MVKFELEYYDDDKRVGYDAVKLLEQIGKDLFPRYRAGTTTAKENKLVEEISEILDRSNMFDFFTKVQ